MHHRGAPRSTAGNGRTSLSRIRASAFTPALVLIALIALAPRAEAQIAAPLPGAIGGPPTPDPIAAPETPPPGNPAVNAPLPAEPPGPPPPPPPPRLGTGAPLPAPLPAGPVPSADGDAAPPPGPATVAPVPGMSAAPLPTPTQPPIVVDPPAPGIAVGRTVVLRVSSVLGAIATTVADPSIASATVDQEARTLAVSGRAVGTTSITVSDARGLTRVVPIFVAYEAGAVGGGGSLRITGNPATVEYLRDEAAELARRTAQPRPGAAVAIDPTQIRVPGNLALDDAVQLDVPVTIQGPGLISVQGVTRVRLQNVALPAIRPRSLLVSDYPERLTEDGVLFTADLTPKTAERFLYYHYNPPGQPDRRIVLRVQNTGGQVANVQFISGSAGPGVNELQVGHASTQRFLVHEAQNEGTVVTLAPNAVTTLVAQGLPAKTLVSNLLQLREIDGPPLHLTLVAQDANAPIDGAGPTQETLLVGGAPHARGIYPIPEFFFDYTYATSGADLEVPIGQIPLPNLVRGQTLAGDYGVLQSLTVRIVNPDPHRTARIALYASPRGGRATGTFLIDRVLVQAHGLPPYSRYKLRQYSVPPGSFIRTDVITMPEGGSSYPLKLIVAPDDGSVSPGAPGSPIY